MGEDFPWWGCNSVICYIYKIPKNKPFSYWEKTYSLPGEWKHEEIVLFLKSIKPVIFWAITMIWYSKLGQYSYEFCVSNFLNRNLKLKISAYWQYYCSCDVVN